MKEIYKVSSKTNPNSLAGAIANEIRDRKTDVEIQCVGAGAVNQAVKAIAIARGFVAPSGIDLMFTPGFCELELDGETRTALKIKVETK